MKKIFKIKKIRFIIDDILKLFIVLCWLTWTVTYSFILAIDLPTYHLDGAFQTASGLFRLNAGQFPGKDFFPYLGIGPIAILFPLFKVLGANLSASVIAAQVTTLLGGVLIVSLMVHFIWRSKLFINSMVAGATLFLAPIAISNFSSFQLPDWISFYISPGNSLRPVRALAPYLLTIGYYFFCLAIKNVVLRCIFTGVTTSLILLWSNDYALPSAGLFLILVALLFNTNSVAEYIKCFAIYVFSIFFSWISLVSLATHGNPLALIHYNFVDVAKDQWWLFGPYGESSRVFNLQQIGRLFLPGNQLPLIVLGAMAVLAIKSRLIEHILVAWIGCVLFVGGSTAAVGGHLDNGYFSAFYYWGCVILIVVFLHLFLEINKFKKISLYFKNQSLVLVAIFSMLVAYKSWCNLGDALSSAKNDPQRFYVSELGGYLGTQYRDYIEMIRSAGQDKVIEEYWGLYSATKRITSDLPVDSVISALGDERIIAEKKLKDADVVISTRYSTDTIWQPWNLSQNYWFYDELLNNRTIIYLSPTTVVWSKHKDIDINSINNLVCHVDQDSMRLIVDISEAGFYTVNLNYELVGNGRFVLMVKNNISFGMDANGYVSLDPNGRVAKFPVYFSSESLNALDIKVLGVSGYSFKVMNCEVYNILMVNSNVLHIPGTLDENFFLTDVNWVKGVAKNWAGFFVPNTADYFGKFKIGKQVRFSDGNIRTITQTSTFGVYLNVYLDGEPLNPEKVGLPNSYVVLDNVH